VLLKAKAAHNWCRSASKVSLPENMLQPNQWEYLVLSEQLFKANSGLGFDMANKLTFLQNTTADSKLNLRWNLKAVGIRALCHLA
jgi:hypothetical protein